MPVVLKTNDDKKVVVSVRSDEKIYDAPHNPPNTGTTYTSGEDLYLHIAKSGKEFFYIYGWSMWQGSSDYYRLISKDEAEEFLLNKMNGNYHVRLSTSEIMRAEELGFNLLEETA